MNASNNPLVDMLRAYSALPVDFEYGEAWNSLVMPAVAEAAFALEKAPATVVEDTVSVMYCAVTTLSRLDRRKVKIRWSTTISGLADLVATAVRRSRLGSVPRESQLIIGELVRVLPNANHELRANLIRTVMDYAWRQEIDTLQEAK